jgi:poly-beta-1,6-N-acetyl-D-glucosamine synthase
VAIFFSILLVLYCLVMAFVIVGWLKPLKLQRKEKKTNLSFISVVVPVRNERENILSLLEDLNGQDYPSDIFEVIVVDDHSEDGTYDLLDTVIGNYRYSIKLCRLPYADPFISTKKKAIQLGTEMAQGEYVLLTDGDCRVPTEWISSFSHFFASTGANFAAGMVAFHNEQGLFQKLQSLEFAMLTGIGAVFLKTGFPFMCNAANMAFKRKIFLETGGYGSFENIVSGDDGFLLENFAAFDKKKVLFLQDQNAIVRTMPQKAIKGFFHQRKRWASKWRLHKKPTVAVVAVSVFLFHAAILLSISLAITGNYNLNLLLVQLILKFIIDFVFLKIVCRFSDKKVNFARFTALEVIYPLYAAFFGIAANFGGFSWKDREYGKAGAGMAIKTQI